jgi:3-hydroxyisobutyrate dehydrogenase-like beta-hydroxyacid dehydrogenase
MRIAVIGLGIMGGAMSENLVRAGHEVVGYDVLASRRARLRKAGGTAARSVGEAVANAPFVITSLPSSAALGDVASQVAAAGVKRQVVIETSTLPIAVKEAARDALARRGVTLLDCPLSGTGAQAKVRDLAVYASGPRAAVKRCAPVFAGFARTHFNLGEFGTGSKMKFLANLLVAIHNVSAGEAVALAERAGLDPALAVKVLGDGAGGSRMLQVRGPMMARRKYKPATMSVKMWQKDMAIIGAFARSLGAATPLFDATAPIYDAALARGFGDADTAAVHALLRKPTRG